MARKEICSQITGTLWKIVKQPGDTVTEEDTLMILESMKMEIPIVAEDDGMLKAILLKEGDQVSEGQVVAILEV